MPDTASRYRPVNPSIRSIALRPSASVARSVLSVLGRAWLLHAGVFVELKYGFDNSALSWPSLLIGAYGGRASS